MYAKRGVPTYEIGFLGRWRSSAVFRYVEEALQSLPLNERAKLRQQSAQPSSGPPEAMGQMATEEVAALPPAEDLAGAPVEDKTAVGVEPVHDGKTLWAVSRGRAGKMFHVGLEAG